MEGRGLVRAGLLTGAALAVAAASSPPAGAAADRRAFDLLNRDRGPVADGFFGGVTELGSIMASAGAAGVLALSGRRRAALEAFGAASVMWFVGQGLKKIVRRPRPYEAGGSRRLVEKPNGTSWPSSHPAVLLAFVTVAGRRLGLSDGARFGLGDPGEDGGPVSRLRRRSLPVGRRGRAPTRARRRRRVDRDRAERSRRVRGLE